MLTPERRTEIERAARGVLTYEQQHGSDPEESYLPLRADEIVWLLDQAPPAIPACPACGHTVGGGWATTNHQPDELQAYVEHVKGRR